jgi:hypothetical protein
MYFYVFTMCKFYYYLHARTNGLSRSLAASHFGESLTIGRPTAMRRT